MALQAMQECVWLANSSPSMQDSPVPCESSRSWGWQLSLGQGWLAREGKGNGTECSSSWRAARGSPLLALWAVINLAAAAVTAWADFVCARLFPVSQAAGPSESELRGGNLILCVGGEPIPSAFGTATGRLLPP